MSFGVGAHLPISCNFYYKHDFIELFQNTIARIFDICAPLYAKGRSLKEISALTGFPYSTVRDHLVQGGVALRPNKSVSCEVIQRQGFKNSSPPPYGYCYLDGHLQKDPREFPLLQIIDQQRRMGKNSTFIAKYLNGRSLRPRKGKIWQERTIYKIIQRLKQTTNFESNSTEVRI